MKISKTLIEKIREQYKLINHIEDASFIDEQWVVDHAKTISAMLNTEMAKYNKSDLSQLASSLILQILIGDVDFIVTSINRMNEIRNELLDIRDEKVRIMRKLSPLQDIEWWEPYNLTDEQAEELASLKIQLDKLLDREKVLKAERESW